MPDAVDAADRSRPGPSADLLRPRATTSGMVAAAVALGVGELGAGLAGLDASPVTAVGDQLVDGLAGPLKQVAVALFGTNDKVALLVGIVAVCLALGAWLGRLARRHPAIPPLGFAVFGVVGAWCLAAEPDVGVGRAVVVVAAAVVAGTCALRALQPGHRGAGPEAAREIDTAPTVPTRRAEPIPRHDRPTRRTLLLHGTLGAVAVGAAVGGRRLRGPDPTVAARRAAALPAPTRPVLDPAPVFDVPGLSPYVTSTADFYRIDTALVVPRVDVADWALQLDGMVERPLRIGYDELLALATTEEAVTLRCVSDEVGGDLVGTARWQGVPLATLLERAGVRPGADQVVGRSVDGWSAGFPTAAALDGRPALVAVAMNGAPLPAQHGFPARLVVAGLYGYVSATKWLERIELTTWDATDGYWIPRGWAKEGPMKLASRIDVPGREVRAGRTPIAGVAWAPIRGVAAVEVRIDDGPWLPCRLGDTVGPATWVQWLHEWDAPAGDHLVRVRAIAADGEIQSDVVRPPEPDGATGLHQRRVRVSA